MVELSNGTYLAYSVYGLQLETNLPIPGLTPVQAQSRTNVRVRLQSSPPAEVLDFQSSEELWYTSSYKDGKGEHVLKVCRLNKGSYFKLSYSDGMEFFVDSQGTAVWATWPDRLAIEDAAVYLLGPVMGFVLRLRGTVCLHASAISIGDQAVALVGPAGAGKSTTAAAFARRGHAVLSDDVVALVEFHDGFLIQPAYPQLRLWPSSVEVLYGMSNALPRLVPADDSWDKCYLVLDGSGHEFRKQPMPLAAIYVLSDRATSDAAPFIEPMSAYAGLIGLVGNSYSNHLLDKDMRAHEFALLNRVVKSVPLRCVFPHTDPARLSRLCEAILDDFATLRDPASLSLSVVM